MNQPHDLAVLIDHLKHILATQPLPQPNSTSNHPILPHSIPSLPSTVTTLPTTPPPDPLTHLTTLLTTHILPSLNLASLSPHYYGFVIGGVTPAALLADFLVSIYDQNVHVHLPTESISTTIEVAALNLLVDLFDLGEQWRVGTPGPGGGVFTTGATASNVLGLAAGREWVIAETTRRKTGRPVSVAEHGLVECWVAAGIRGIKVLSSMPHSSVIKAAAAVGIGRANVLDISSAGNPVAVDLVRVEEATRSTEWVYILAISAGEVNTGSYATEGADMMRKLRELCDQRGIWIHVDGAFGLFGRILQQADDDGQYAEITRGVAGLELADSITGDGHKLLNVPYDCGLFFTRHKSVNEQVFQNGNAAYLKTTGSGPADAQVVVQSPLNMGIENSRRFRALPVWATLMAYGRDGYVDMLRRQIGLARRVVEWMWEREEWEVLPVRESKEVAVQKTFMVVLFRARYEQVNETLVKKINDLKRIYVSGTQWDGVAAARIAISNWQVDVERDFKVIRDVLTSVMA